MSRPNDGVTVLKVRAGDRVTIKVDGPATVTIERPKATAPAEAAPADQATVAGLAEAIALVTARRSGIHVGLSGDVAPGAVTAALAIVAASLMAYFVPPDRATAILADIGLAAATEDST